MWNAPFDFDHRIAEPHREIASRYIGSLYRPPDLIIAPEGHGEYLFRWHVVPRNPDANIYFHIQTQSDPERPLHDHPWDSVSVILAGGYTEIMNELPMVKEPQVHEHVFERKPHQTIFRKAEWAHRLILPDDVPYSMSLFSTGPKVRKWGFWTTEGFVPYSEITIETDGKSSWKEGMS